MRGRGRLALCTLVVVLALPAAAQATYPGGNGRILMEVRSLAEPDADIFSMNPDGTGRVNITQTPDVYERGAKWSPDGTRIAFIVYPELWVMNADGSGRTNVTPNVSGSPFFAYNRPVSLAWSPDGTKIAYTNGGGCWAGDNPGHVMVMNPDGSNPTRVSCGWQEASPPITRTGGAGGVSWSPDGRRLVFDGPRNSFAEVRLWTVNSDGTGKAQVAVPPQSEANPNWSPNGTTIAFDGCEACANEGRISKINPDGSSRAYVTSVMQDAFPVWAPDNSKIAFSFRYEDVYTVKPDGSERVNLTATSDVDEVVTDWLAIPQNAYPRPRGATPTRVSLVTAYNQCTSSDRTHGPPLAFPACSSPTKTSSQLTVGTGDSNGKPALNEGYLTLSVMAGAPGGADDSDVMLDFFLDDVFTNALADYTGNLRAHVSLQITDRLNTPAPSGVSSATSVAIPVDITVACAAVPDPNEGSACASSTSVDALIPGAVPEGRRAIWELGRVEVYDGTDTLFATQGVFIP